MAGRLRKSDIVWRNTDGSAALWRINGFRLAGSGMLGTNPGPDWQIRGTGDFNGDGKADLLWWTDAGYGTAAVWLASGPQVTSTAILGGGLSGLQIAGCGDFNGDGKTDILWRQYGTTMVVSTMNGTAIAGSGAVAQASADWQVIGVADFDSDGKADILWRNTAYGTLGPWRMDGFILSQGAAVTVGGNAVALPAEWTVAALDDFTGDGKADILWRNQTDGRVALWEMDGSQYSAGYVLGQAGADWKIEGSGDYNGDGKADILWRNSRDGTVGIWDTANSLGGMPAGYAVQTVGDPAWSIVRQTGLLAG